MRPKQQGQVKAQLGGEFEQNLLLNLGYAARIYPDLWRGLETDQPVGITLNLDAAFNFFEGICLGAGERRVQSHRPRLVDTQGTAAGQGAPQG